MSWGKWSKPELLGDLSPYPNFESVPPTGKIRPYLMDDAVVIERLR